MPYIENDSSRMSTEEEQSYITELKKTKLKKKDLKNLEKLENDKIDRTALREYEKRKQYLQELNELAHKQRLKDLEDETKTFKEKMSAASEEVSSKIKKSLSTAGSSLYSNIEKKIDTYINNQTAIAAHLVGSNDSLDNVTDSLVKLSGTGLVQQTAVYNNLSSLVKQGIVSNVEQKAFLQTLANDIDATFNASDGTLVRLINLQQEDLSANRLAIEYSLQEFLNQNYETSTYIKESFQDVSKSLIEMQSLMTTSSLVTNTEAIIQAYLGSLYSSGMSGSTVSSIASAINALGSGDTSNLGSGVSNLVLMAASKMGLDYSELLTNGLDGSSTDTLMQGIAEYMAELYNSGNNVVRSQLASVFGVTVSDLVAARNFEKEPTEGEVTDNIYTTLLDGFDDLVPAATKISNLLDNFVNGVALNIATNDGQYMAYKVTDVLTKGIDELFGEVELGHSGITVGTITQFVRAAAVIVPLAKTVAGAWGSFGDSASDLFKSLANEKTTIKSAGAGFDSIGVTTSGSVYMGSGDTKEIIDSGKGSYNDNLTANGITGDEETYDTTDIYKILDAGSVKLFGTYADKHSLYSDRIAEVINSDMSINVASIASTTVNIYDLLDRKLEEIINTISTSGNSLGYALENISSQSTPI